MGKLPYMPFYPSDWLAEPGLRICSKSAKAFWIDLLCVLWGAENRGVAITGQRPWTDLEISAAVSGDTSENLRCLLELCDLRVCSRNISGAIYSRRIVRDEDERRRATAKKQKQRQDGMTYFDVPGLVPPFVPPLVPPNESDIEVTSLRSKDVKRLAEEIYQLYPRKVGRGAALKAICKALSLDSFDVLSEAVRAYAAARVGEDEQYTPHPATWFNQQRWKDDRSQWSVSRPDVKAQRRQDEMLANFQAVAEKHGITLEPN